ncbi:MAG TPA: hypothetical protein VHO73_09540 [Methylomirabilota bacterium]|jgi:hypothetical protein|nr:hypothetical protein [Methylomirabilota bacterium]
MSQNGTGAARWWIVVKPEQRELIEILRARLEGSGVEVQVERRARERRRGSLGPLMDRRVNDRRRQRPVALLSVAAPAELAEAARAPAATHRQAPPRERSPREAPLTHPCPICLSVVELELPRFPHPPARVEMEVGHVNGNNRDAQHYVEIAAFTVSGRMILSQRVPARRPA